MRVVCNTSPLILLAKIQRLELLAQLYDEIIIPEAVLDEIWTKSSWETDQQKGPGEFFGHVLDNDNGRCVEGKRLEHLL